MNPIKGKNGCKHQYPKWDGGERAPNDPGRRRFIRQLLAGVGAGGVLGTLGLPRLSHGQSHEVDFQHLENHPAPEMSFATEVTQAVSAAVSGDELGLQGLGAGPAAPAAAAPAAAATTEVTHEEVVENRALWVEPGYLVLLRWSRQTSDETSIPALEGLTETISAYLQEHVQTMENLHDIANLHVLESQIAEFIANGVAARVEVVHLDHDCSTVCNLLPSSNGPIDDIPVLGGAIAPPGWE